MSTLARPLTTLTRAQGANRALVEGDVTPDPYRLQLVDEPVLVRGFRKMVRGLEYDVAELALTTYLTAKEHGARFTALPVFLVRGGHHGAVQVRRDHSREVSALAGTRIGVNRGYTVTTGVWARAALAEHGLDLDSVTWVRSGDEHVEGYRAPANVVGVDDERSLEQMLLDGDLDAVVGASIDHPDVVALFADPDELALRAVGELGGLPINHLVVVRDELLAQEPALAPALVRAFTEAKDRYVEQLRAGTGTSEQDRLLRRVLEMTGRDPLPYGLEPNRATLEHLVRHARAQHILTRPVDLDEVFVATQPTG